MIVTNRGVETVINMIEINNIILYSLIIQVGSKALNLDDFVFAVDFIVYWPLLTSLKTVVG